MGNYRIVIEAVGNHGCCREVVDGGFLGNGCNRMGCPDCEARRFVRELSETNSVQSATLIHWPGDKGEVVDDLLPGGKRKGSF